MEREDADAILLADAEATEQARTAPGPIVQRRIAQPLVTRDDRRALAMMPTGGVEQLGQAHPAVRDSIELPRVTGEMVIAVSIKRFEREHALEAMADLIIVPRADHPMTLDALVDDKARLVGSQHPYRRRRKHPCPRVGSGISKR